MQPCSVFAAVSVCLITILVVIHQKVMSFHACVCLSLLSVHCVHCVIVTVLLLHLACHYDFLIILTLLLATVIVTVILSMQMSSLLATVM